MSLPTIAIVGRPNVGKSSLLNMLAGRRISIVEPTAGVTRDRIQATCEHEDTYFDLVDTGGYGIVDRDDLGRQVKHQITQAVQQATLIIFLVDGREGLMPLDQEVAEWLRPHQRPVLLVANKVDADSMIPDLGDFHRLGFGLPLPVSALHRRGLDHIRNWIVEHLPPTDAPPEAAMKLAIVGRRNAGKSTFLNALAGAERVIVSEIPGTTRDAVDVRFELDKHAYVAIDTAGIRKKSRIADDIEYYGSHRAELSIRRADVVLLLIDSTEDVGSVDKHLGGYIVEHHKPCVIVINKWDLAKDRASSQDYGDYLLKTLPGLDYAPVAFTTAKTTRNVRSVLHLAASIFKQARTRVTTGELNQVLQEALQQNPPRPKRGTGTLKMLYATQVAVCPPTIVLFLTEPSVVTPALERFLLNRIREALPFAEVPVRLIFRGRRGLRAARELTQRSRR
ncbi:MAG TPA: ribosome biogenesis GTPase Der [Phycisphaerae bacterium]|nr:ribosome biogenesis GTPase Der [Phycisphaerae bacterium]